MQIETWATSVAEYPETKTDMLDDDAFTPIVTEAETDCYKL